MRKQDTDRPDLSNRHLLDTYCVLDPWGRKTSDANISASKGSDRLVKGRPVLSASRVLGRHRRKCPRGPGFKESLLEAMSLDRGVGRVKEGGLTPLFQEMERLGNKEPPSLLGDRSKGRLSGRGRREY